MGSYVVVTHGEVHWRAGRDAVGLFTQGPFADMDACLRGSRVLKDLHVKRTHEVVDGERVFYLKVYKEGGWGAKLRQTFLGSKAEHELEMCLGVMRRGVPTVPLTAVGERGWESYVVVEKLDGWRSLEEMLLAGEFGKLELRQVLFQYGVWARQVHDAGVWQHDFNPSNVLAKEWGDAVEFKIIDFEKMRLYRSLSEPARLKLLAKLSRMQGLAREDWRHFLEGYLHKYPEEQRREGEIVATLERYEREVSERDTVKMAARCVEENRNFGSFETERYLGYHRKPHPDGAMPGLDAEAVRRIAAGEGAAGTRTVECEHALHAWRTANVMVREGAPAPLAVFVEKGKERGFLVYAEVERL
jgi:hypothetical protein